MGSQVRWSPAKRPLLQETLQLFSHRVADHAADCVDEGLSQRAEVQLRQGLAVSFKGHGSEVLDIDLPAYNHRLPGGWSGITLLTAKAAFSAVPFLSLQALATALCLVAGPLPGIESILERRLVRLRQVFHSYRCSTRTSTADQLEEEDQRGGQRLGRDRRRGLTGDARVLRQAVTAAEALKAVGIGTEEPGPNTSRFHLATAAIRVESCSSC